MQDLHVFATSLQLGGSRADLLRGPLNVLAKATHAEYYSSVIHEVLHQGTTYYYCISATE